MKKLILTILSLIVTLGISLAQQTQKSKSTEPVEKQPVKTVFLRKQVNPQMQVSEARRDSIRNLMEAKYRQSVLERQARGEEINPASMESMFLPAGNDAQNTASQQYEPKMKQAKGLPFQYEASDDPKVEMENYTKAKEKWIRENPEAYRRLQEGQ